MRSRVLLGVGAVLVAAGAAAFAVTVVVDVAASARVVGGNFPVNASARRAGDLSAHNSPSIVRNPTDAANIVIVNRLDRPDFACAIHVSHDGGATFTETGVPVPEGAKCFAPDAAFDSSGVLYVSFVTLEGFANVPAAGWVTASDDGGVTFGDPRRVLDELSFQVRITADPERPGRLYLTWLQAEDVAILAFPEPGYPILFARSDDGGETWTEPRRVSPPQRARVVAPSPAVGGPGEIFVAYLDLREDRLDYHGGHQGTDGPAYPGTWELVLARSLDAGATWSEVPVEDDLVPTERFIVFLPPFPSVAAARASDDVHVGFHDGRTGDADVYVWTSRDRGRSFEPPVRVNQGAAGDGTMQRLPKLAVSGDGRLDVLYYDGRAGAADRTGVSLGFSFDGARSFRPSLRVSDQAFPAKVDPEGEAGLGDLGSRLGLLSAPGRALAVWADTRAATPASGKQDIVRALVEFSETAGLAAPVVYSLRYGGLALALIGLGVAASVQMWPRAPEEEPVQPKEGT